MSCQKMYCLLLGLCVVQVGLLTPCHAYQPHDKYRSPPKQKSLDVSGWHALSAHLGAIIVTSTAFGMAQAIGSVSPSSNAGIAPLLILSVVGATSISAASWFGVIKLAKAYQWSPRWGWILNGGLMGGAFGALWSHSFAWFLTGPNAPSTGVHIGLVLGGIALGGVLGGGLNAIFLNTSVKPSWYTIGAWLGLVAGFFAGFPVIGSLDNPRGTLRVADNFFIAASTAAAGAIGGGLLGFLLGYLTTPRRTQPQKNLQKAEASPRGVVLLGRF